jgi:uroporphyrinogen decarboxylase
VNSRERVRIALSHHEPDRVPVDFGGTFLTSAPESLQRAIAEVLGLRGERDPRFPDFDHRIQDYFDCDLRSVTPVRFPNWGYREVHEAPLRHAAIEDLDRYCWPEPKDELVLGVRERAQFLHERTARFVCASQIGEGIFETGCYLRGYDQILLDMALDPAFVHAFNRKVLETDIRLGDLYFPEVGDCADMVLVGDDLATQHAPYMSPAHFREFVKPYFREYIAAIKRHCPRAVVAHHCCGSSFRLLDDLTDIGIEVINPVQTTAAEMSPGNLATKKHRLSFLGGVDLQHVLPYGTAQEVEDFVKDLIRDLAPGGGYILAACHTLPEDVKPENIAVMLEAARRWGGYPLGW